MKETQKQLNLSAFDHQLRYFTARF